MKKTKKQRLYLGVDPGAQGFIVAYNGQDIVYAARLPFLDKKFDTSRFRLILDDIKDLGVIAHCYIEHQQSMGPPTSPRAAFNMGFTYGCLTSALFMAEVKCEAIRPRDWKKEMGISISKKKGENKASHQKKLKELAIYKAQQLAPKTDFRATTRSKVPHDGKCEAFLLSVLSFRLHR
jgi:hypothetical protein